MKVTVEYKSPPIGPTNNPNPGFNKLDYWNDETEEIININVDDAEELIDRLFELRKQGMVMPQVRLGKYVLMVDGPGDKRGYLFKKECL